MTYQFKKIWMLIKKYKLSIRQNRTQISPKNSPNLKIEEGSIQKFPQMKEMMKPN